MVTPEQLLYVGGIFNLALLGICGFFMRRLLADHDQTKQRLTSVEVKLQELKLSVEQNFVSFATFEATRNETRNSLREIYAEQAKAGQILARLDERSQLGERIGALMDAVLNGKNGRK